MANSYVFTFCGSFFFGGGSGGGVDIHIRVNGASFVCLVKVLTLCLFVTRGPKLLKYFAILIYRSYGNHSKLYSSSLFEIDWFTYTR